MMMKLKTIQEMQRKQHKTSSLQREDSMPASILHPSSTSSSKGNTGTSNLTHPSAIQLAIVSDLSKAQRISNENDVVRRKTSNSGKKVIYLS